MSEQRAFVTGSAGFIGYHLCERLLAEGWEVTGFDGMTTYYDARLKQDRTARLAANDRFRAVEARLEDMDALLAAASDAKPDVIVHLAAQAGVRHSLEAPREYLSSNAVGSFNVLEVARLLRPRHLLIASTSSVYGANESLPFREVDKADTQLTIYSATKKASESMSHAYAHLWDIPTTQFHFFTVYGPWGRPDMALFKFVSAILAGDPIDIYNRGEMYRDFTYIDDLIEAIRRLIDAAPVRPAEGVTPPDFDSLSPVAPWRTVNIGNAQMVRLMDFVAAVEDALQIKANMNLMEIQPGDVKSTWADTRLLRHLTDYAPATEMRDGVARFVAWYRDYYKA